ncbi:MAG TPA: nuclear transport factor 2 family protein, partial [Burkholderiaceae bacterium]|nr:nuclear transport factor 2 family protein [Burkholderiaceae bacterium]
MTDDVLDRYFDAWNRGRDDTFAAIFATSGTYCDPMTGGPIPAAALPGYAGRLRAMLPDLRFEIGERTSNADGV